MIKIMMINMVIFQVVKTAQNMGQRTQNLKHPKWNFSGRWMYFNYAHLYDAVYLFLPRQLA